MLGGLGAPELIIIALIALVLFGGSRIADIGKGLGQGIKNFKEGLKEGDSDTPAEKSAEAPKKKEEAAEKA